MRGLYSWVFFSQLSFKKTDRTTVASQRGTFKCMLPEIALNRWLTCVCTVSATKKITVRGRWKCPWCRPALMSGFPLSFSPLLLRFFRVIPCARELSIPASRDWGPCCALWWRWCPPSSYSSLPVSSVRPALLLLAGLKPWNSRKATSSRPDRRNHNSVSAWISPCNQPTHIRSRAHLINPSLAAVTKAGFLCEWHMHTNTHSPWCIPPTTTCLKRLYVSNLPAHLTWTYIPISWYSLFISCLSQSLIHSQR